MRRAALLAALQLAELADATAAGAQHAAAAGRASASGSPMIAPTSWDVIGPPFPASAHEQGADALSAFSPEHIPKSDDDDEVAAPPAFAVEQAQNNCYGDPTACLFRGRTGSAAQCQGVCSADAACHSYTWVGETGDSFEHECRTRDDTAWQLVAEAKHTSGYKGTPPRPPPFRCRNATSCNNGGECDAATGTCQCDPTWRGATCAELSLQPAQSVGNGDSAFVLGMPSFLPKLNTWGGSVVASAGRFDMFAAAFINATLNDWETKSIVIHLKSESGIQGPYDFTDVVAEPRRNAKPPLWDSLDCHNPTVHRFGDEYVVFYIGVGVNVSGDGSAHDASSLRRPLFDKAQSIGAAFASSPDGPWTRLQQPLLIATEAWECGGGPDCGVSNPAIMVRADGKLNMFYRGNQDRGVGVAFADTWRGPWTKSPESINSNGIFKGNSVVGLEDLYVWTNPKSTGRVGCHMVLHQEEAGTENLGAHAFTEDPTCVAGWGLTEPRPSHAYGPEFSWTNGSTTTWARRERPQIVLDKATGWPTHLSNGVTQRARVGPASRSSRRSIAQRHRREEYYPVVVS